MNRKASWVSVLALACTLGVFVSNACVGAAEKAEKAAAKPAPYAHVVIFYMTKDAPKEEADSVIADCHEMLAKISSVRDLKAGRPSDKGTPMVGRTDYQVGLLVLFDDAEGLKTYLDDEKHTEFIKKHGKYWDRDKLVVFDFQNQAK